MQLSLKLIVRRREKEILLLSVNWPDDPLKIGPIKILYRMQRRAYANAGGNAAEILAMDLWHSI
jgi:hypothetical protein